MVRGGEISPRHVLVLALGVALLALLAGPAGAGAATPMCAQTEASAPNSLTAGDPCWTDTIPYPFGFDGTPADPTSPACQAQKSVNGGETAACYLEVDSMAFRAWNRGLAVASAPNLVSGQLPPTAFGVWLYNGNRWFPDPTFPGQSVCRGTTILWAGKLDYWVVGSATGANWPSLCRFDAVNFAWEPLRVPKAALAHVPLICTPDGACSQAAGAIDAGACMAWNNCWFFGSYGIVLHWDGAALTDATPNPAAPWLRAQFTAAVARTDTAGNPFAVAVAGTLAAPPGQATATPTPAQPDGLPPPQFFESAGGAFAPLGFEPPTNPVAGDRSQTDLAAVDFNSQGQGWVAGDPRGVRPGGSSSLYPHQPEPAPVVPVTTTGSALPCPTTPPHAFTGPSVPEAPGWVSWSTIGVLPDGSAIAGGETLSTDLGNHEPALAEVSCTQAPVITEFRTTNPVTGTLSPANGNGGFIASVAVNASNAGWAAAEGGSTFGVGDALPHLYHLTDGQPPLAPAGDDNEPRPLPVAQEPSLFVLAPPVVTPPPPPPNQIIQKGRSRHRKVKLPSPISHIRYSKLKRAGAGKFELVISFRVVRKVTIGVEALRGKQVVGASGLKTFRGARGRLVLRLDPKHWPKRIKFVLPSQHAK